MASWRIIEGDCVEVMAAMEEASIDAVVCDPPYGLGFMGKDWDSPGGLGNMPMRRNHSTNTVNTGVTRQGGRQRSCEDFAKRQARDARTFQEWSTSWTEAALRVLKPGGHLLAFGGTRTYHRLACAVEDAGLEIRDTICWLYGSGFPKSLDVSKAIDKAAGAERDVVGTYTMPADSTAPGFAASNGGGYGGFPEDGHRKITAPATPEAEQWSGWGTALKPAHEPIVVARKPLVGTVAGNVTEYGTGALNIDGCRVAGEKGDGNWKGKAKPGYDGGWEAAENDENPSGRWPANVVLDPDAAGALDEQTGELSSGRLEPHHYRGQPRFQTTYGDCDGSVRATDRSFGGDSGGASRFFYVAKASRAERNAGLQGFEEKMPHDNAGHVHADGRAWDVPGSHSTARANHHPTVKPIALMRWLVRLVTPPGGTVLDPFTGSGTTGCAAVLEGFDFIGCERDPEYVPIAEARIAWWAEHPEGQDVVAALDAESKRQKVAATGQDDLFSSLTSKDETAPPPSSLTAGNEAA